MEAKYSKRYLRANRGLSGDEVSGLNSEMESYLDGAVDTAFEAALRGGKFGKAFKESLGGSLHGMLMETVKKELFKGGGILDSVFGGFIKGGGLGGLLGIGGKGIFDEAGGSPAAVTPSGFLEKLLGSKLSFFGGGLGGVLGGAGVLMSLPEMFSKGHQRPELSDVDEIFDGVRLREADFGALFGSDEFERAVFSARNAGGAMYRKFTAPRLNSETAAALLGAPSFDAAVEDRWVVSSKLNEMAGIPRRTNFNHG
jgi:hypothetical protein